MEEQVLCRSVASLNLRYYDGTDWLDEWDSTADANSLPLAVEIDIEIAQHDKHSKELQKRRLVQSFALPCKTADHGDRRRRAGHPPARRPEQRNHEQNERSILKQDERIMMKRPNDRTIWNAAPRPWRIADGLRIVACFQSDPQSTSTSAPGTIRNPARS